MSEWDRFEVPPAPAPRKRARKPAPPLGTLPGEHLVGIDDVMAVYGPVMAPALDEAFRQDIETLLGVVERTQHVGPANARATGQYNKKGTMAELCARVRKRLEGSP